MEITQAILKDGGLESLDPQAADYGYHFYYDFKEQKYVSLHDDDAIYGGQAPINVVMKAFGADSDEETVYKKRVGNSFTYNGRYYLVDGTGALAEAISEYVNFAGKTQADVIALCEAIEALGYEGLTTYVEETVFVTENGNFVISNNRTNIVIVDGVEVIENKVNGSSLADGEGMISNDTGITIKVPSSVTSVESGALVVETSATGEASTIVFPTGITKEQVEAIYEAGFTDEKTVVVINDDTYKLEGDTELVNVSDITDYITLSVRAVMEYFDILVKDIDGGSNNTYTNTLENLANIGYFAWNGGALQLSVSENEIVNSNDGGTKVSTTEVIWSFETSGIDTYLDIDSTGKITVRDTNDDGAVDKTDYLALVNYLKTLATDEDKVQTYFTVKATSVYSITTEGEEKVIEKVEDGDYTNCPTATMDVRVVFIDSVGSVKIETEAFSWIPGNSYALSYSNVGQKLSVVVDEDTIVHNWDGEDYVLDLDYEINLAYECLHKTTACCPHAQELASTHTSGKDSCEVCYYTQSGHTHDGNCCTHGSTCYTNANKVGDPYTVTGKTYVTATSGTVQNYRCSMCTTEKNADGSDHWCYSVVVSGKICYDNSVVPHYGNPGELWEVNSCANSCQKGRGKNESPVTHTTHNSYCCNHDCTSDDQTCSYVCTHDHATDTCTANANTCGHTSLGSSLITNNVLTTLENLNGMGGKISVTIDSVNWGTVNVTLCDFSANNLIPSRDLNQHSNVYVGNGNSITLGDLFDTKDIANFPANSYAVIFTGSPSQTNYMNLGYAAASDAERLLIDLSTAKLDTEIDLSSLDVTGDEFKYYVAIYQKTGSGTADTDYTRVSEDVTIHLVEGYNIHTFQDIIDNGLINLKTELAKVYGDNPDTTEEVETNWFTGEYKHVRNDSDNALTTSIVLWDNIKLYDNNQSTTLKYEGYDDISVTFNYLEVPANKTLYGNNFTFDVTNGRNSNGIIKLTGTLRDTKVTGAVYTEFAFRVGDSYGSAAVRASGNAKIINCYISNTRSPLRVDSGTVTIKDSVLFGGRYANIDTTGGTLTVQGKVTLIQRPIEYVDALDWFKTKYVIGLGVSAWFNDNTKTITLDTDAELVQYNFLSEELKSHLPTLKLTVFEIMDTSEPFEYIFNNQKDYGNYWYVDDNGTPDNTDDDVKYVNSGMVAVDAYYLKYGVTDNREKDDQGNNYSEGDTVTLKVTSPDDVSSSTASFVVTYPAGFVPAVTEGKTIKNNTIILTGAELAAGVVFKADGTESLSPDAVSYSFHIASDAYKTLSTNGSNYGNLIFKYSDDLRGTMASVSSLVNFHSSGLHYGYIIADVYSPIGKAKEFGEYRDYVAADLYYEIESDGTSKIVTVEEYNAYSDADKESWEITARYGLYDPEVYGFTNGSLVITENDT